jgi:hypothetical protein
MVFLVAHPAFAFCAFVLRMIISIGGGFPFMVKIQSGNLVRNYID